MAFRQQPRVETVQQREGKMKHYYNVILKPVLNVQLDINSCVRERDVKKIVKRSDMKINVQKVNKGLKGLKKSFTAKVIFDVLSIFFYLAIFIYSIVQLTNTQKPLAYHKVCHAVSLICSVLTIVIKFCALAHTLYTYRKTKRQRICRVGPMQQESNRTIGQVIKLQDMENEVIKGRPSQAEPENTRKNNEKMCDEKLETNTIKELTLDMLKEIFIYPTVICHLYELINEKSWEFDNSLAKTHFIIFLLSVCYDALYTKLKYIIYSFCDCDDNWKTKLRQCWISSLKFMPYVFLFALLHWLILAIIGVRIYVDNFSTEIDQGNISETSGYPVASYRMNVNNFSTEANTSETGGYKVSSYTSYMIFCGFYLPIASVAVYIVLIRAWFSDENKTTCMKIFHFLVDPIAYIAVITLMPFFIAFCVGIYLPDYDNSEFEVDANARAVATYLGIAFIIVFLVCNIKATLAFVILIVTGIPAVFICVAFIGRLCYKKVHGR